MRLSKATVLTSLTSLVQATTHCRTLQVVSGDSCTTLASKCGVSATDFTKYNPSSKLCSTLSVGQHVCCSTGSLPAFSPKPQSDGTCATYKVPKGAYCSLIASKFSLTVDDLEKFNKNTWGWMGCAAIEADFVMCTSAGSPPMPAIVPGAICGPQKNGTVRPKDITSLAKSNPCPLNACCDKWGQCGTTAEFCTATKSPTGAPGTAANGTNGCISNCGTGIVNHAEPPAEFKRDGYFEAWNADRPCLRMSPDEIDTRRYTHVHYAFGAIDRNTYTVNVSSTQNYFNQFKRLKNVRRVLSFGGWAFSTSNTTYDIFREGVSERNHERFASNVARFAVQHNLSGVDFDWEYPGETGIAGIPPSNPAAGMDYLRFLRALRSKLPAEKTISIAAPASYWYLKGFPIADMAKTVDYIVYMTYDLYGQWQWGKASASPGCETGGCLRSHVNLTATVNALAMLTKADVPASKVVVGVASYGRSFKKMSPNCTGPSCRFTGPGSGAEEGPCTQTPGFLANAEIAEIRRRNPTAKSWYDEKSASNIMTWNSTQWVGYMNRTTKARREKLYQSLNFGGWVEWAIDLESFHHGHANGTHPHRPSGHPGCPAHYDTLYTRNEETEIGSMPEYAYVGSRYL